ncbi:acyl-CoA dehydrogenase family protein [Streptomyces eurythermus]|uniref:acyl-CoA dehydrogenase family protein n=1 Tax=Streptomyces eurythermus TaxID=42237 RepID=UPI0027A3837A|nr:acyl-CoA dehydrogenase family protein [Streptomyces lavenduligriseus]
MDFALTTEQQRRRERLLAAIREELPGRRRTDPADHFDREDWARAAALGLTGLCLPEESGGGGLGALDTALCLEAFGQGCLDTGLAFGVAAHLLACAVPVRDFAGPELREELLKGLSTGSLIASNAITEDAAGSDTARLEMTARRDGDVYVLDGVKSFASNAPLADVIVTYAVTEPAAGFLGTSGFVVPRGLPGLSVGPPLEKMGLHGCPAGRITFDGVRVPARFLLGVEGQGRAVFQHSMGWERACLFAIYLGVMTYQLQRCVAHVRSRKQFRRRLADFQAVSHKISVMSERLEGARLLLYRACWLTDQGTADAGAVSLAKVAVSEAAVANARDAVQVFGGIGYLASTGIEQQLRDAVPSTLFSGTTEIHRSVIARERGL